MATPGGFPYFLDEREPAFCPRKHWGWLLGLGIVLIVAGTAAIAHPAVATVSTVTFVGVMLLFAAGAEISSAFWARRWGGFATHLLMGLIFGWLGVVMLDRPAEGAKAYTLMLAIFFVAGGLVRLVFSLSQRFSGWGWMALSGGITLLLGVMIWKQLPESALWVIGTFVGVDLLFLGWSWVMLALAVKTLPEPSTAGPMLTPR